MATEVGELMRGINQWAGPRYRCSVVSWDDSARFADSKSKQVSFLGPNITDTYLKAKDGRHLFTLRSANWDEALGTVSATDVALIAGVAGKPLRPVTLNDFLGRIGTYGAYAGLNAECNLLSLKDARCSVRFQTTFLPLGNHGDKSLEFATEAYNYQTKDDENPKNLVLLCTTQGVAVQQDEAGAYRLFHHGRDVHGNIQRRWLQAEESAHAVGKEQRETAEEGQDAIKRGKAVSSVIGPRALGTRFNVLMTVQVPLAQRPPPAPRPMNYRGASVMAIYRSLGADDGEGSNTAPPEPVTRAARVSKGSSAGTWNGLKGSAKSPTRHPDQHITITVVVYNTVRGGVPSESDVRSAVEDLDRLFAACGAAPRSSTPGIDMDISDHDSFPSSAFFKAN